MQGILTSALLVFQIPACLAQQYTTTVDVPGGLKTPFTVSSGTYARVSSGGTVRFLNITFRPYPVFECPVYASVYDFAHSSSYRSSY